MSLIIKPSRRDVLSAAAGLALAGATVPARAATRNTDVVRLTWGPGGLPLIAKERGEFDKRLQSAGIKVEWLGPFPNHAPTLQAVTGNSADFGFGGSTTPAFAAMIAGSPLVFSQFLVIEPRTTAIIARPGSGISNVVDLVGKSVAVNRSGLGEFLLVAALEKNKVDRSKVNFVYLNPPDAGPAFASGKVDAWSMWSPGVDIARQEFNAHEIFNEGRDLDFPIDFYSFVTRRKFVEENSEIVRAVNEAYAAEAAWASEHPEDAERIAQRRTAYSDAVRDHFVTLRRKYRIYKTDDQDFIASLQRAADWLSDRKVLPERVKVVDLLGRA